MISDGNKWGLVFVVLAMTAQIASCGKAKDAEAAADPKKDAVIAEVTRLTEKAYNLKQIGSNGEALSLLDDAASKLEKAGYRESEPYASNLDDRATIHLRMGHNTKAKTLYLEGEAILEKIDLRETRLFAGIERRLTTMKAFETLGIVCDEKATYTPSKIESSEKRDGGVDADVLPYFPKSEDLQAAFGAFNLEMKGCIDSTFDALPIWVVITGDGRIALSSVKSESVDQSIKDCLEKKLREVSAKRRELLPRFRACFRNYTYPLAFRK